MARPPQVTRHIIFTRCICQCVDATTGTIFGLVVDLPRIVKDRKRMLKKCREIVEKDKVHIIQVEDYKYMKAFALQTEIEFLHNGKILALSELDKCTEVMAKEED